ncbi:MAG: Ppx/GppA family phosphatase [Deltaproteobacteria bacterium]|nr:MAG: Ppx/GppA family phosphatase [Deltaproteobacteria bacterium]
MKIASIDLGTNTALLLIADVSGIHGTQGKHGGLPLHVLHDEARITRLGEKLHETKKFIPEARERVLSALLDYRKKCDELGVEKILAVGTAAFRKAQNAQGFVDDIKNKTDIEVRIISGDEEARLSYLSAEHDFGAQHPDLYVLDIGGGSTEIISKEGGVSFDVGAVILTESLVKHDPVTEEEFLEMKNKIEKIVGAQFIAPGRDQSRPYENPTLIGLAGSVTTLSAIKQSLKEWDGSKVQGSLLTIQDIDGFVELFRKTKNEERRTIVGMVKGREDTILAGTLILQCIMKKLAVSEVIVSDRGLRCGLLY